MEIWILGVANKLYQTGRFQFDFEENEKRVISARVFMSIVCALSLHFYVVSSPKANTQLHYPGSYSDPQLNKIEVTLGPRNIFVCKTHQMQSMRLKCKAS